MITVMGLTILICPASIPTQRELEALRLVAQGYANARIGAELNISEKTVKNHMTSVMRKLDASNRTGAVMKALELGYLGFTKNSERR